MTSCCNLSVSLLGGIILWIHFSFRMCKPIRSFKLVRPSIEVPVSVLNPPTFKYSILFLLAIRLSFFGASSRTRNDSFNTLSKLATMPKSSALLDCAVKLSGSELDIWLNWQPFLLPNWRVGRSVPYGTVCVKVIFITSILTVYGFIFKRKIKFIGNCCKND